MKESEMFQANSILKTNQKRFYKKASKVLELLKDLDDNEGAIIVEVLHDKYGLTYIESGKITYPEDEE